MTRGYIVIAQNNDKVDYLGKSCISTPPKATQSTVSNSTVCVDEFTKAQIKCKHTKVFDYIVDIPGKMPTK